MIFEWGFVVVITPGLTRPDESGRDSNDFSYPIVLY